jgi:hypothetical protein
MEFRDDFFQGLGMAPDKNNTLPDDNYGPTESSDERAEAVISVLKHPETKAEISARLATEKEEKIRRFQESRPDIFG